MTNYINVPVLLILFISALSSCNSHQENTHEETHKEVKQNGKYVEKLISTHLLVRNEIREFHSNLHQEDSSFLNSLIPFMVRTDSIMSTISNDSLLLEVDSVKLSLNNRLFADYMDIIHSQFVVLNEEYNRSYNNGMSMRQRAVDSIWNRIDSLDQLSLSTFAKYYELDSSTFSKFKPLQPIE